MKFLLLFLCVVIVSANCFTINNLSAKSKQHWDLYKTQFSKNYESENEEKRRMSVFLENKKKVEEHNQKYQMGLVTYEAGFNHLSDMTTDEVILSMTGFSLTAKHSVKSQIKPIGTFEPPTNVEIPPEIDWRTKGAVTGVKAQGICGACWAFSTTGALEGQVFIKTGKLLTLSEQNLIDCSRSNYGNNGCDGGVMDNAFTYIKENKGIDDENRYPYEAVDDKDCRYTEDKKAASDSGFYEIASGDEEALMKAVATVGPISVAIQAMDSIKYYNGGVYYESGCSTDENDLNHAVLLVGYGNDTKSGEYWLVKNSWDTSYGEEGYIRMARNRGNNCGIATHAVYPKV